MNTGASPNTREVLAPMASLTHVISSPLIPQVTVPREETNRL